MRSKTKTYWLKIVHAPHMPRTRKTVGIQNMVNTSYWMGGFCLFNLNFELSVVLYDLSFRQLFIVLISSSWLRFKFYFLRLRIPNLLYLGFLIFLYIFRGIKQLVLATIGKRSLLES